jgi:hypothetical protein
MAGNAWPSDSHSFKPEGAKELPVKGTLGPKLGKVVQFDPIVPRHPRPMPQAAPPAPPIKPPHIATAAPSPDDDSEPKISAERLAFLERVEALVGAESKINDLETENRLLVSMVARLQNENEALKKGKA